MARSLILLTLLTVVFGSNGCTTYTPTPPASDVGLDDESPLQRRRRLEGEAVTKVPAAEALAAAIEPLRTGALPCAQATPANNISDDESPEQRKRRVEQAGATKTVTAAAPQRHEPPPPQSMTAFPPSDAVSDDESPAQRQMRFKNAGSSQSPPTQQPSHLATHIATFLCNRCDQSQEDVLEQSLAFSASATLNILLGLMPAEQEANDPAALLAPTDPYCIANSFWAADLAGAIARRLSRIETLSSGAHLLALAITVPNSTVRAALLRAMEKHWWEGPAALSALATERLTLEPGFVALVKRLPRKAAVNSASATAGNNSRRAQATKIAKLTSTRPDRARKVESQQHRDKIATQWLEFSHEITRVTCRRLDAASDAQQTVGNNGVALHAGQLPLQIHPGATTVATYRLDWPGALHSKVAAAPTLRVRYLRLDQKARPAALLGYYRRQLPDSQEHATSRGWWVDRVSKPPKDLASVDVLIERAAAGAPNVGNQEQELNVEILTIECGDL